MEVVATSKGKYGAMRERGDAFTLDAKRHFSERWMVKANSKEAKAILAETRAEGVTEGQIAAEVAAATGKADAAIAEKDARIAELEAALAAQTGPGSTTSEADGENAPADEEHVTPDEPGANEEAAPASRKTRRRRG